MQSRPTLRYPNHLSELNMARGITNLLLRLALRSLKYRQQSVLFDLHRYGRAGFYLLLSTFGTNKGEFARCLRVDLIIGPRTGDLTLLLSASFIARPFTAMTLDDLNTISAKPQVSWAVPISLGICMQALTWWVLAKIFLIIFKRVSRYLIICGWTLAASNEIVIGAQVAKSLHTSWSIVVLIWPWGSEFSSS